MMSLLKLATLFRAGQLYAHHAHNNAKGSNFFPDHEFFGELYPVYEAAYDSCVERYIGTCDKPVDGIALSADAADLLSDFPKDGGEGNRAFYQALLRYEMAICDFANQVCKGNISEGLKQMVGTFADESEVRQYKMKQRLKP